MGLIDTLSTLDAAHSATLQPRREMNIGAIVQDAARKWIAAYRTDGGPDGAEAVSAFVLSLGERAVDMEIAYGDGGANATGWTVEALAAVEEAAEAYDATGQAGDDVIIGLLSPALDDLAQEVEI